VATEIRLLRQEVAQLRAQNEAIARRSTEEQVTAINNSAKTIVGGVGGSIEQRNRNDVNERNSIRRGLAYDRR